MCAYYVLLMLITINVSTSDNNNYTIAAQRLLNERITQGARPNIPGVPKELVSLRDRMVSQIPSDRPSFEEVSYLMQNFCSEHGYFDGK